VQAGLPQNDSPLFEWAVTVNGMLYKAQSPVSADGAFIATGQLSAGHSRSSGHAPSGVADLTSAHLTLVAEAPVFRCTVIGNAAFRDPTGDVAAPIKAAVREATRLHLLDPRYPNKLLAKIGRELDQPYSSPQISSVAISRCPARKMNGIVPRGNEKLPAIGIATVGELAQSDIGLLQDTFGRKYANWLARVARDADGHPL
jgi:nucleotidyltransferase/DNA polymerase involved in DNA repair